MDASETPAEQDEFFDAEDGSEANAMPGELVDPVEELPVEDGVSGVAEVPAEKGLSGEGKAASVNGQSAPDAVPVAGAVGAVGAASGEAAAAAAGPDVFTVGGHSVALPVALPEVEELTEEEVQKRLADAVEAKTRGNEHFRQQGSTRLGFTARAACFGFCASMLCPGPRPAGPHSLCGLCDPPPTASLQSLRRPSRTTPRPSSCARPTARKAPPFT